MRIASGFPDALHTDFEDSAARRSTTFCIASFNVATPDGAFGISVWLVRIWRKTVAADTGAIEIERPRARKAVLIGNGSYVETEPACVN